MGIGCSSRTERSTVSGRQATEPTSAGRQPSRSQRWAAAGASGWWRRTGRVHAFGNALWRGDVDMAKLAPGERVQLDQRPFGGQRIDLERRWVLGVHGPRSRDRVSVPTFGDVSHLTLNGPVIASAITFSGLGYYMIASDGGIFAFGDAIFRGSMGGRRLNAPVVGMAPDPDGLGYWLVAADGGIFGFDAEVLGSVPGVLAQGEALNKPVIGAVAYGAGYLMLGSDGGVFNFSDGPFVGSLGGPPEHTDRRHRTVQLDAPWRPERTAPRRHAPCDHHHDATTRNGWTRRVASRDRDPGRDLSHDRRCRRLLLGDQRRHRDHRQRIHERAIHGEAPQRRGVRVLGSLRALDRQLRTMARPLRADRWRHPPREPRHRRRYMASRGREGRLLLGATRRTPPGPSAPSTTTTSSAPQGRPQATIAATDIVFAANEGCGTWVLVG